MDPTEEHLLQKGGTRDGDNSSTDDKVVLFPGPIIYPSGDLFGHVGNGLRKIVTPRKKPQGLKEQSYKTIHLIHIRYLGAWSHRYMQHNYRAPHSYCVTEIYLYIKSALGRDDKVVHCPSICTVTFYI